MVPELFNQLKLENQAVDFPNLALALSKGSVEKLSNPINELALVAELSNHAEFNQNARAALYLHGIDEKPNTWVCYASPVLIQPNRDHLSIVQADGFELEIDDAKSLCSEFNDYFKDDGLQFGFTQANTWFCYHDEASNAAVISPTQIIGKNILEYLPSELSDVQWRKMFNETQMLLHHSATNQRRVSNGKPEINSLWFWGGGILPEGFDPVFNQIFTNNPEMKGLAKLMQSEVNDLPDDISTKLIEGMDEQLFVVDFQYSTDVYSQIEKYVQECLQLLKNKSIDTFQFIPDYGQKFTITASSLKKFWKVPKNISTFIH